jgi:hypothetical protein
MDGRIPGRASISAAAFRRRRNPDPDRRSDAGSVYSMERNIPNWVVWRIAATGCPERSASARCYPTMSLIPALDEIRAMRTVGTIAGGVVDCCADSEVCSRD